MAGRLGQFPPGTDPATASGLYWSAVFTHADMNISSQIRWYEVYRAAVQGAAGSTAMIYLQDALFDQNASAQSLSWDWTQPMHVTAGQDVTAWVWYPPAQAAAAPPRVTLWLRYDTNLMGPGVRTAA